MAWVCNVCGYVEDEDDPPASCPVCGAPEDDFVEKFEELEDDIPERDNVEEEMDDFEKDLFADYEE